MSSKKARGSAMAAAARTDTPSVGHGGGSQPRPEGDEGGKNDGTLEGDARHVAEMRMELHRIALGSVYESMLEKRHTQVKMIRAEEASELSKAYNEFRKEDEGIVKAIREEWQRVAECANATHQAQTEQGSGDLFKKQIEKLNKDEADLESSVQELTTAMDEIKKRSQ